MTQENTPKKEESTITLKEFKNRATSIHGVETKLLKDNIWHAVKVNKKTTGYIRTTKHGLSFWSTLQKKTLKINDSEAFEKLLEGIQSRATQKKDDTPAQSPDEGDSKGNEQSS